MVKLICVLIGLAVAAVGVMLLAGIWTTESLQGTEGLAPKLNGVLSPLIDSMGTKVTGAVLTGVGLLVLVLGLKAGKKKDKKK